MVNGSRDGPIACVKPVGVRVLDRKQSKRKNLSRAAAKKK
jgi:hypothetical protein